jgi:hypothetical protein
MVSIGIMVLMTRLSVRKKYATHLSMDLLWRVRVSMLFGNFMKHIIDLCVGWREEDYDGYNNYYVNPEYHRSERIRKRVEQQKEDEYESK